MSEMSPEYELGYRDGLMDGATTDLDRKRVQAVIILLGRIAEMKGRLEAASGMVKRLRAGRRMSANAERSLLAAMTTDAETAQ